MTHTFKPGDTVALKSGGHPMTCNNAVEPTFAICEWFDESGACHSEEFSLVTLAPITRKAVHIDEVTIRHIWVFAETGEPIADHIAMRAA